MSRVITGDDKIVVFVECVLLFFLNNDEYILLREEDEDKTDVVVVILLLPINSSNNVVEDERVIYLLVWFDSGVKTEQRVLLASVFERHRIKILGIDKSGYGTALGNDKSIDGK